MNQWRVFKGYDEEHQYHNEKGRILGFVRGSNWGKQDGWTAHQERYFGSKRIGRYISLETAKAAVEEEVSRELADQIAAQATLFKSSEIEGPADV